METPQQCLRCPREVKYQSMLRSLALLREGAVGGAEIILDDTIAANAAAILHEAGALEKPDDVEAMRQLALDSLEDIDTAEAMLQDDRKTDTQFCIGALRLRVQDNGTRYDATICRSPNSESREGIELVAVERKRIT